MKKLYIITGGPGAGKTTLLNELNRQGLITVPEEGRRIIQEQITLNGEGVPWINKAYFAELMFEASVRTYREMEKLAGSQPVFFDRGILDTIGYLRLEKIPVPKEMEIKARDMMYHNNVFILPPWKEIYENDQERKQTFEESIATFDQMKETYQEYGYTVVEIPEAPVKERVGLILDHIQ